jgi:hypothetical protein
MILTAAEVEALPEGTPVTVTWSGGNGPHDYVIAVDRWGRRYAWGPSQGDRTKFYNPLEHVGQAKHHTHVSVRQ